MTDYTETVKFTTIDQGSNSDYREGGVEVITRIENWRVLWQQHKPDTPVPSVDFGQYQLVAVFMGEQPSSSYKMEITKVEMNKSGTIDLKVDYTLKGKALDNPVQQQPYHIIQMSLMT